MVRNTPRRRVVRELEGGTEKGADDMTLDALIGFFVGAMVASVLAFTLAYRYTEKHIAKAWAAAKETVQEELELERWERDFPGMYGEENWTCALCGCTNDHACDGGCYWVYPNLCSACAEKLTGLEMERRMLPISAGCGDTLILECDQPLAMEDAQKLQNRAREIIERSTDVWPGLIMLGQGFRLVGVIHGSKNQQKEGMPDERSDPDREPDPRP